MRAILNSELGIPQGSWTFDPSVQLRTARVALQKLPMRISAYSARQEIVRQGQTLSEVCIVLRGFVCRYRLLNEGQKQIMSVHLQGDSPNLTSVFLPTIDYGIHAASPTQIGFIPHEALKHAVQNNPSLSMAFWYSTLLEASISREWIAALGRRTATQRFAHLICEIYFRGRILGLNEKACFELPLSQTDLGDTLGISSVHVNRVLQDLRNSKVISTAGRQLTIHDWPKLKSIADFDPSYLLPPSPTFLLDKSEAFLEAQI